MSHSYTTNPWIEMTLQLIHSSSPLISILTHLATTFETLPSINFLYTTRLDPSATSYSSILFLDRLCKIYTTLDPERCSLGLYLTSPSPLQDTKLLVLTQTLLEWYLASLRLQEDSNFPSDNKHITMYPRRISYGDLDSALGPIKERSGVLAYVCGPPEMTDEIVGVLKASEGMSAERVLCEKWW